MKKEQEAKAEAERIKKEEAKKAEEKRIAEEKEKQRIAAEKEKARLAEEQRILAEKEHLEKQEKERQEAAKRKEEEEIAIANMKDPIQDLFVTSIRAYSNTGGLENADPVTRGELKAELARVAKQFGGSEGEDMSQFPTLDFKDPEVESINISS